MRNPHLTGSHPSIRTSLLVATLVASAFSLHSAEQNAPTNSSERNYVVYVGLDVAVQSGREEATVVASSEKSLTVVRDGGREQVAIRDAKFQLTMEPKLSRQLMTIDGLKGEAVQDPRTDPSRAAMHEQMLMDSVQDNREQQSIGAEIAALERQRMVEYLASQPNPSVTQAEVQQAQQAAQIASATRDAVHAVPAYNPGARGMIGAGENHAFDSYEVTFRLSAPESHKELLGLLRMQVRDPATTAAPAVVLKFFTVRNIGPEPRKVTVTQSGLPAGFAVDTYSIHLYEDGVEFPTNISKNRMEISAAEAQQFLILRHAQLNAAANLPATIIFELIPVDLRKRLDAFGPETAVEIAIDRNGRVTGVKSASSQSEVLASALRDVPFLPALLNGQPVESKGSFVLSEFMR